MIEITIKKTNGEIVKKSREGGMTEILFEKMAAATAAAGKGELLSWEHVDSRTTEEKNNHALYDEISRTEIALSRARDYDLQKACVLRDKLETLKA